MPADPHQRDEMITAAVIDLLRTKGPRAVNVEAVAEHAGVAKTTIYRRYRDREEMIAAALTSLTSLPPPPDGSDLQPMLQWVIQQSFNAIESGIGLGGVAALLTDEDTRFTALIRALLVEHRAALAAVVEDAAAAGQLRADLDVDTMLDCIVGAYLAETSTQRKRSTRLATTNPSRTMACCCRLPINRKPPSRGVSKSGSGDWARWICPLPGGRSRSRWRCSTGCRCATTSRGVNFAYGQTLRRACKRREADAVISTARDLYLSLARTPMSKGASASSRPAACTRCAGRGVRSSSPRRRRR